VYDLAIGDLGLSKEEFERMSWGEFLCRHRGYQRHKEAELQQVRLIMWAAVAPHQKRKISPQDLMPLPGDKNKAKDYTLLTAEQYQAMKDRWLTRN